MPTVVAPVGLDFELVDGRLHCGPRMKGVWKLVQRTAASF